MASRGGVFQDMKVVPLLIVWSVSLLHAGDDDLTLSLRRSDPPRVQSQATSVVIQRTRDASFPDDSGNGILGSSVWDEDEEDSVEDMFLDTGLLTSGSSPSTGHHDLSSLVRASHDLYRIPSYPHPLRC